MTWLTPLIAGIAAAIAVPTLLILYFLKLRRRQVEVSTTLLWKKAIQDLQANAPFQKLRRNILLLLQLLILAAALFAVAQPQLMNTGIDTQRHIIMIDRSASMSAEDETEGSAARSRLDAAKDQARAFIDTLREPSLFDRSRGDEAMIIAFDASGEIRQPFTNDRRLLKSAIDAITPVDTPTSLDEAMKLAMANSPRKQHIEGNTVTNIEGLYNREPISLQIWTDGRIPDAGKTKPGNDDVIVVHRVGQTSTGNIGIVSSRAERAFDQPIKLSLFVGLQSTEPQARDVDVELSIDGQVVGIRSVSLPAAKTETSGEGPAAVTRTVPATGGVVFKMDRAEAGLATIRLRVPAGGAGGTSGLDALETDNRAWVAIPPAARLSVAVVTSGNLFLSAALKGLPLAELAQFTPADFEKLLADGKAGKYDVIILDGWLPAPKRPAAGAPGLSTADILPPGRYLILNSIPGPGFLLTDLGKGETSAIIDWRRDHPVMKGVNLESVIIAESRPVQPITRSGSSASVSILATSDRGPAIVEIGAPEWRAIAAPFDVAASTWPFDVSFVVFMAQSVNYLGSDRWAAAGGSARAVQPGSVLSDRLPAGAQSVRVREPGPDGRTVEIAVAADGRVVYGPIRASGAYELSWIGPAGPGDRTDGGRVSRTYAANLLDSAESDIAAAQELTLASSVVQARQTGATATRKLWPWLILGALAILMLEWFVYNKKVQV
ncbi:MAG: VWA domain-containing protein [Phycisphaerales bacterium]|nr:VWA domain-containing protein [Phycisphaerales bacterium]